MPEAKKEQVLSVRDLDITFKTTAGPVHAIRGVNIDLYKGETVALVGESATVKRLFRRNGKIILHPENEVLDDFVFNPEEVSILGKVVGLIRNRIA